MTEVQKLNPIWAGLQNNLEELLYTIIEPGCEAVYIDYPVHTNIGDLMIYLGTEVWMRRQSLNVINRWHIGNFSFPALNKDCRILLHGGGNFSDLYVHQKFREKVVTHYPENRIVFLPQSIFYINDQGLEKSASLLSKHTDLHILIRDQASIKRANNYLSKCRLYLSPDMSVFLYPLEKTLGLKKNETRIGNICLERRDIENAGNSLPHQEEAWRGDWKNLLGWRIAFVRIFQILAQFNLPFLTKIYSKMWQGTATFLVYYCANYFNQSNQVSTSRLHGHILASLLMIRNELYDNVSEKNSSYYETWHKDLFIAKLCK